SLHSSVTLLIYLPNPNSHNPGSTFGGIPTETTHPAETEQLLQLLNPANIATKTERFSGSDKLAKV
ncbi:MAG: hypothetical protein CME31_16230, partial [Gimesia sp.]|nr:hypothetical protein [Gimesia sp.]